MRALRWAAAQDKPAATASSGAGIRGEFLDEVIYYEQRFTQLAGAIPAEKYTCRPADGVRSIGEVYMHVVAANYGIANALARQFRRASIQERSSPAPMTKRKLCKG